MKLEKKAIIEELNKNELFEVWLNYFGCIDLETNLFKNFTSLQHLKFYTNGTHCKAIKLKEGTFNGLEKLETLSIEFSNLTIEKNSFHHLTNIKSLTLNYCDLNSSITRELHIENFYPEHSKEKIQEIIESSTNLSSFEINSLSSANTWRIKNDLLSNQKQLEYMRICIDKLEQIEEFAFKNLSNLNQLYIKSSSLKGFSSNCFSCLVNLEVLTLNACNQTHFVGEKANQLDENAFKSLKFLKELRIDIDYIPVLSKNLFFNLKNLVILSINASRVDHIDEDAFHTLKDLKEISLVIPEDNSNNPQGFKSPHLHSFKIKNGTFKFQTKLEKLMLNIHKIEFIEDKALRKLVELKYLNINFQRVKKITKSLLSGLNNLEKLIINENCEKTMVDLEIEENSFDELKKLTSLSIYVNKLTIRERMFKNLLNLEILIIGAENMGKIYKDAFKNLNNLHSISINKIDKEKSVEFANCNIKEYFGLPKNCIYTLSFET